MLNWDREAERYIDLARRVQAINERRLPLACGSGALPDHALDTLYDERLVDAVCFNLEVWSEALFSKICPGKNQYVGYDRWIRSLEQAVARWGRGRVYSAMVAGAELEPEHGLSWQEAAALALEGADDLCSRGVLPVYSLYWPPAAKANPERLEHLRAYFERLQLGYRETRARHGLSIWDGFMCHRCAYMQVECDLDRAQTAERRAA